jgi:hypothetical protein
LVGSGIVRLTVHAQPGARRNAIVGVHGDALKIAIAAQPVDGKANDAIVAFLAESFDVPRRAVSVVSGQTARRKTFAIEGLSLADARERLSALLAILP